MTYVKFSVVVFLLLWSLTSLYFTNASVLRVKRQNNWWDGTLLSRIRYFLKLF